MIRHKISCHDLSLRLQKSTWILKLQSMPMLTWTSLRILLKLKSIRSQRSQPVQLITIIPLPNCYLKTHNREKDLHLIEGRTWLELNNIKRVAGFPQHASQVSAIFKHPIELRLVAPARQRRLKKNPTLGIPPLCWVMLHRAQQAGMAIYFHASLTTMTLLEGSKS